MTIVYALSTQNKVGLGLISLAWIVFSLAASMLIPRSKPDFPGRHLPTFLAVSTLFFIATVFAVFLLAKESHHAEASATPVQTQTGVTSTAPSHGGGGGGSVDLAEGKRVWDKASCGGCHVLKAAGSTGTVGPDLDKLKPSEAVTEHQVTNGGPAMPAFKGILTPEEIKAVSAYVAAVAGKS